METIVKKFTGLCIWQEEAFEVQTSQSEHDFVQKLSSQNTYQK